MTKQLDCFCFGVYFIGIIEYIGSEDVQERCPWFCFKGAEGATD